MLRVGQLLQTDFDRRGMIRNVPGGRVGVISDFHQARTLRRTDPINSAPRKLQVGRQIKQPVLKTRGAEIGDEDFHGLESVRVISG